MSIPFKAIIFDMDGLLVDSEVIWQEAEDSVLAMHNVRPAPEVRAQLLGLRNDEFMRRLREIYNIDASQETLEREVIARMLRLIPHKVKPQPGAVEMLAYVAELGLPTAIASSSPNIIIETVVKTQGWRDVLPVRCSAEHLPHGKPAPDVYLKAAEALGVDPLDCLALEDSANGARAAVAAGMTCYAVPESTHSHPERFAGITPHVFRSLHEVMAVLQEM
ncbi:MAG: HAD-IA family hydrolase [Anaerolineae bacterium]|nr:HAD-IA family hydrolase [Anaerolineae bacterium]